MKIKYDIKGVTLDVYDLIKITQYYEASCTAEYIMDFYDITDENEAMEMGYEVRRLMDKGYEEDDAILEVLKKGELE